MTYQEAVDLLLVTLSKIEHAGFDVDAVDDFIRIKDEDGENEYVYVLTYEPQEDQCVWWAKSIEYALPT